MDKGINIRSVLLVKKAVKILDYLGTEYDIEKLKKRPDICKEIINKFKTNQISKHQFVDEIENKIKEI